MADASVQSTSPSSHPGRRAALLRLVAGGMAATAAAAPAAVVLAEETDPHPAWYAEREALVDWCNHRAPADRDLQEFPQYDRLCELDNLIFVTPARTPAGARVQVAFVAESIIHNQPDERHDAALASALAVLDRLAAEREVGRG